MASGHAWCGFFVGFAYVEAAEQAGLSFSGKDRLHSVGKSRSYFHYRVYTQRSTRANIERWEALRSEHQSQGITRRYFTLRDSNGDRWARRRGLSHMVYADPNLLPIRAGDMVIFPTAGRGTKRNPARGHMGLVEPYDPSTCVLTTIEGNTSNRVRRKTYNLRKASTVATIDGFGRPALGDYTSD